MANIKALKAGNHNDPTVWDGGVVPGIGDTAFANTFTIEIVADWELDLVSIALDSTIGAVAGGRFNISNVSPTTIILDADAVAGTANTLCIGFYGTGEKIVNGTVIGGTANMSADGCRSFSTGPVFVNTVYGGPDGNYYNYGLRSENVTGGYVSIINVYAGKHAGVNLVGFNNSQLYIDFIYGNDIYGNPGLNTSTGIIFIGQATAGYAGYAVDVGVSAVCVINEVIAGVRPLFYSVDFEGCLTPGVVKHVDMLGLGYYPIKGPHVFSRDGEISVVSINENDEPISLVLADSLAPEWYPTESDVRSGISYANGGLVGTCKVPTPEQVAFGIEVDDTVGVAVITNATLIEDLETLLQELFN